MYVYMYCSFVYHFLGSFYSFHISISTVKLLRYINIISLLDGSLSWFSLEFKILKIGKLLLNNFTRTFVNKPKMNRILDQMIIKVHIAYLFMIWYSEFKALQKAWNTRDLIGSSKSCYITITINDPSSNTCAICTSMNSEVGSPTHIMT